MKRKYFVVLSLVLILALSLSACGGANTEPMNEEPMNEPVEEPTDEPMEEPTDEPVEEPAEPVATLRIWADDTRTPILQGLADEFLAEYNVELIVEDLGVVQDIRSQVIIAIPAGEGPDIFIGVHDWLGAMIESGLVTPLDLGDKTDLFVPVSYTHLTLPTKRIV
mgnify:CR=1 FL=1